MKIPYKHFVKYIKSRPSIEDLSKNLFQLGHEHEIENNIFNFELTPNRGDCFSLLGLLRELKIFYEVDINFDTYKKNTKLLDIDFKNEAQDSCKIVSFMRVEINDIPKSYKNELNDYFNDLQINKNNFFTDVSNFISYEMGQPTHCYDALKISKNIILKNLQGNYKFQTLLDKEIELNDSNLVFLDGENIINIAGVIGSKGSACSNTTKHVLIECAYFNPEAIIGKSLKYDIKSDAAHKFERGVDPACHEIVLRRFLKIIDSHTEIKNVEIVHKTCNPIKNKYIDFDTKSINKILGTNISDEVCKDYLLNLGFIFSNDKILPPSYRSDIKTQNDISEEIARAYGYNNIASESFVLKKRPSAYNKEDPIDCLKYLLFDNGFHEVINNPFTKKEASNAVMVDNPLDSNREYLRTSLQSSLINNLLYNERRQKDSIKLFEVSNIYTNDYENVKRVIGIIATGRVGKNYLDFSKKINNDYLKQILNGVLPDKLIKIINIPRNTLNSKLKDMISYIEIDALDLSDVQYKPKRVYSNIPIFNKYNPISDLPSSSRDISFSVKKPEQYNKLEDYIFSVSNPILREVFIFDFFNKENKEIKIGFRFIFQSKESTITDNDINLVINEIIQETNKIDSVSIPGINLTN